MVQVCFATPLVRPLLDPDFAGDFGGAEVRALTFARGLAAAADVEVSMLLHAHQKTRPRQYGLIRGYFLPQPAPIPRTRELPRDITFLWNVGKIATRKWARSLRKRGERMRALKPRVLPTLAHIPADGICVFGVHHFAADVVASARSRNRKSILFLASDTDLDARYLEDGPSQNDYGQESFMCRYVLTHADLIVAQTDSQQRLLWERFGRRSSVIRNPIDLSPPTAADRPRDQPYVLWVGRADTFSKRADKCLDLARRCPEVNFVLILNKRNERVFAELTADLPANVMVVERVPHGEIDRFFQHAVAVLNTSDAEGFPNAFLQAGRFGVPVVSLTVDPGEMLSRHRGGACCHGDLDEMAAQLQKIWTNHELRAEHSHHIANYVRQYHERDARVRELRAALDVLFTPSQQEAA